MTYRYWKYIGLILFAVLALVACGDDAVQDNTLAVQINAPMDGAVFNSATENAIELNVDIQADLELHQISMVIHEVGDETAVAWMFHGHGSGSEPFNFSDLAAMSNFSAGTSYRFKVQACGNHMCEGTNIVDAGIGFSVQ